MSTSHVKLVTIITGFEYEARVIDSLRTLGANGYTSWTVRGSGLHGSRESSFWSGANVQIQVLAAPDLADRIIAHLGTAYLPDAPLTAFSVAVDAIPEGHFHGPVPKPQELREEEVRRNVHGRSSR
jgi:hypothetical protein